MSTEYNHDGRRVWVTSRYAVAVSPLLLNAGRTTGVPRKPVVMTYRHSATATLRTPYGLASCDWALDGARLTLAVDVPPNTSATIVRPGLAEPIEVGSGHHVWTYDVADDVVAAWRDEAWDPGP